MKLYALFGYDWEGYTLMGVYSTPEKAEEERAKWEERERNTPFDFKNYNGFKIEEGELDKEWP
jgi:hypothetical protein